MASRCPAVRTDPSLSLVPADMSSPRGNRCNCRISGPGEDALSGVVLDVVAVLAVVSHPTFGLFDLASGQLLELGNEFV
jgi:hypothetical protein